jgi:type I restriction enzyme M protein
MVALPGQLFYSTQISVCLWFLSRDKKNGLGGRGAKMRDRRRRTLFIDARKLGTMIDRVHRQLTDADIARITDTYHRWRGDADGKYKDVAGFCKTAATDEIRGQQYILTPGRYVGAQDVEEDDEPFEDKVSRLASTLEKQFAEGAALEASIRLSLKTISMGRR